jgi:dUTP pyrophosphatase
MKIKIKKLSNNFELPKKATDNSVCYDVVASSVELTEDINSVIYKLGFSTEIPIGWKGVIVPRSSLTKTNWVMLNSPGQIDSDYRGEWLLKLTNIRNNRSPLPFVKGDRVAQIYFEKVNSIEFELVEELSETDRNEGGFGSTGK